MVDSDFYKGVRFFRVIDGFMAQFVRSLLPAAPRAAAWKMCADSRALTQGIHGKPAIAAEWKEKTLTDDPVVECAPAFGPCPVVRTDLLSPISKLLIPLVGVITNH